MSNLSFRSGRGGKFVKVEGGINVVHIITQVV